MVPLAAVSYFPSLAIMGRSDQLGSTLLAQYLSPLVGVAFLIVSRGHWIPLLRNQHIVWIGPAGSRWVLCVKALARVGAPARADPVP